MQTKYEDVTEKWIKNATQNSHKVKIDKIFIDDNGIKHPIKGIENSSIPDKESDEFKVALVLERILGGDIHLQVRIETAKGSKGKVSVPTPDYKWNGEKWDLKTPSTNGKWENAVERFFKHSRKVQKQAKKYIIDFKNFDDKTDIEIISLVEQTLSNPFRDYIQKLIILKGDKIIKIYSRKLKNSRQAKCPTGIQM